MTSLPVGLWSKEDSDEEIIFERKASVKKKKKTKQTLQSSSKNTKRASPDNQITENGTGAPTSRTLHVKTEEDIHLTPVCPATGTTNGEVWINMETSDSTLLPSLSSTSVKSFSAESLFKEPSTSALETADDLTLPGKRGSTPKSTIVTINSATVLSSSTPAMKLLSSSKDSEGQTSAVDLETGATNSSIESCKTPVAPSSDVVITMEDDDMLKSPLLISENESSSAEMIYARGESTTETKVDADETKAPFGEVLKTNDGDGAQCENDEVPIDEGRQLAKISFNTVPAYSNDWEIFSA